MKDKGVKIGGLYTAKVTDKLTTVRIDSKHSSKGWHATNTATGKKIRIKSGQRLRAAVNDKLAAPAKSTSPPAKKADAKPPKVYDPNKCATPRCKGEVELTHLGKPLCQKCWTMHCGEVVSDVAADAPATGKPEINPTVEIITGQPVAKPAKAKPVKKVIGTKSKRVSALDAAATLLETEGKPMRAKAMIEAMAAKGLWTSPGGKTPEATLYSAILREIGSKGDAARFTKAGRGKFAFKPAAKEG